MDSLLANNSGFYVAQCNQELHDRIAFDAIHGITATANGFYGPQGRSVRLKSNMENRIDEYAAFRHDGLRVTNFEMESAGIYAMASMLGHKALSVCAILVNRAEPRWQRALKVGSRLFLGQRRTTSTPARPCCARTARRTEGRAIAPLPFLRRLHTLTRLLCRGAPPFPHALLCCARQQRALKEERLRLAEILDKR
jgi:hypothetical protein